MPGDTLKTDKITGRHAVYVRLGSLPRLPPRIRRPKWTHRSWLIPLGHIERQAYDWIDGRAADSLMGSSVAQLAEALLINRTRAHRIVLHLSDKGWVRPTDRFRTRWLPTMKAWLGEHISEVERAVELADEAIQTGNRAMHAPIVEILARLLAIMPNHHRNGTMARPADFGRLTPASAPMLHPSTRINGSKPRPGTDCMVRQSLTDPPDEVHPAH